MGSASHRLSEGAELQLPLVAGEALGMSGRVAALGGIGGSHGHWKGPSAAVRSGVVGGFGPLRSEIGAEGRRPLAWAGGVAGRSRLPRSAVGDNPVECPHLQPPMGGTPLVLGYPGEALVGRTDLPAAAVPAQPGHIPQVAAAARGQPVSRGSLPGLAVELAEAAAGNELVEGVELGDLAEAAAGNKLAEGVELGGLVEAAAGNDYVEWAGLGGLAEAAAGNDRAEGVELEGRLQRRQEKFGVEGKRVLPGRRRGM